MFADLSKNLVDIATVHFLAELARECGVEALRDAMFAGTAINTTEGRAVLHTALRAPPGQAPFSAQVHAVLDAMLEFAEAVRARADAAPPARLRHVVNIGIGGSDLGPQMAVRALAAFAHPGLTFHFVANVDGDDIASVLTRVKPDETLFLIASKTFTTQETLANAATAKAWFLANGGTRIDEHFAAATSNVEAAARFGITRTFGFWDWVGGRYSLWSAIGLPIAIAIGAERFRELLAGAHAMDRHFAQAPIEKNLPLLLGLVDVWYRNFHRFTSRCIAPYAQALQRLPAYLQQLEMESNGKRVDRTGAPLHVRDQPGRLGRAGNQRPARLFPDAASGQRRGPGRVHPGSRSERGRGRRRGRRRRARAPAPDASRQRPGAGAGADGRSGRGRAAPRLSRQPAEHDAPARAARAALARRADRALRAPRLHVGRDLGHRQLRPVGRRARQGPRQRPPGPARGGERDADAGDGRSVDGGAPGANSRRPARPRMTRRWRLFPKYALLIITLVGGMLVVSGAIGIYFSWRETEAHLVALQVEKAESAANRIEQYVLDIEHQMSWTALPRTEGDNALEQRRFEYLKLLRQAPAITEVVWIDAAGREQLRISRLAMDAVGSGIDLSSEPKFKEALAGHVYYGPVYFRKGTEPYMTIARPAGSGGGVTAAEVNLKFVWDVVSRIKIGEAGLAYVIDATGTLIAHPDISLVLKKSDLSALPQVAALARADGVSPPLGRDLKGDEVFAAHAPIPTLRWTVFVESPRAEAFAPLYATLKRTALVLVAALLMSIAASFFLARALVRPLRALQEGAAQIGAGDLDRHIEVRTGDELEGLAEQFNHMSAQLRESYSGLERKVEQRTAELSEALDYQTAISDVLRVISQSPSDVAPVFQAILESASRLFGNPIAAVFRYDGHVIDIAATRNWPADAIEDARRLYPGPPRPEMMSGRVVMSGQVQIQEDALSDPTYDQRTAAAGHWRRMIGAPLLKDGLSIGVIVVAWPEPGKTPQRQADLLKTFADQAVIAIENVRLFNETREALEQQTATAEVLGVISGSVADSKPVFEKILESCQRLFASSEQGVLLSAMTAGCTSARITATRASISRSCSRSAATSAATRRATSAASSTSGTSSATPTFRPACARSPSGSASALIRR